jgi:hypothetical protein
VWRNACCLRDYSVVAVDRGERADCAGILQLTVKWISGLEVLEFACVHRLMLKQVLPLTKLCNNLKTSSRFVFFFFFSFFFFSFFSFFFFFFFFFTDALQSNAEFRLLNSLLQVSSIFDPLFPSCRFAFIYICLYTVTTFADIHSLSFMDRVSSVGIATC